MSMIIFGNYITKCVYLMEERTPVSVYRLLSSLFDKSIVLSVPLDYPVYLGRGDKSHCTIFRKGDSYFSIRGINFSSLMPKNKKKMLTVMVWIGVFWG